MARVSLWVVVPNRRFAILTQGKLKGIATLETPIVRLVHSNPGVETMALLLGFEPGSSKDGTLG